MAKVVPEDEFCGLAEEKYYENINKKNFVFIPNVKNK